MYSICESNAVAFIRLCKKKKKKREKNKPLNHEARQMFTEEEKEEMESD